MGDITNRKGLINMGFTVYNKNVVKMTKDGLGLNSLELLKEVMIYKLTAPPRF